MQPSSILSSDLPQIKPADQTKQKSPQAVLFDELYERFPSLFKSGEDGDRRLDLERLKTFLGEDRVREKYGLRWENKPEQFDVESVGKLPGLERIPSKSIRTNPDKPTHVLIEGDNYHALQVLAYTHARAVDVIYIDPPYNTGSKDFKYNDLYVDKCDDYRHSKWLSFMHKRLNLAKRLLKKDGVVIVSIGEDELSRMIMLLEEIYPYVSEPLVWLTKSPLNQNKITATSAICHEYVIVASLQEISSKNESICLDNAEENEDASKKIAAYPLGITLKYDLSIYNIFDVIGRRAIHIPDGDYTIGPWSKKSFKGHRFQKRTCQTGHGSEKYSEISSQINETGDGLIVLLDVKDRNGLGLKFLKGNSYFQSIDNNVTLKIPSFMGQYQGGYPGFSSAKPLRLIQRLINIYANNDAVVLDFFAGSGTTCHAVMQINAEIGGFRRCILVTNDEGCFKDSDGGVIVGGVCTHVTYPRLQKVIEGYTTSSGKVVDGLGENLEFFKTRFEDLPRTRNQTQAFAKACTSILELKSGCYDLLEETQAWSLYKSSEKHAFILYDDIAVEDAMKRLGEVSGPIEAYVFSYEQDDDTEELLSKLSNVTIQKIPSTLIELFRRIKG